MTGPSVQRLGVRSSEKVCCHQQGFFDFAKSWIVLDASISGLLVSKYCSDNGFQVPLCPVPIIVKDSGYISDLVSGRIGSNEVLDQMRAHIGSNVIVSIQSYQLIKLILLYFLVIHQ